MRKAYRFLPLVGGLLLAGCPSEDDGGTEPTPTIAVSIGGAIIVVQGQTGSSTVTITRGGGFDGAVTLAATGLPTGVTAGFNPATIPTGGTTSTLTLTAAPTAATGTASFSVTANGGTNLTATTSGSVTVNAAPDFTLAVAPAALSVQQGANGVANVTLTRVGGFAGAVNLTVANLPAGVTAAFDNAAPTGNAAVLTLTVGAAAALGTTNLTVNGAGTPGTRSGPLALTVTAPPGGFSLALNPATVSVQQGQNGQTTVNINKTGSFTGLVTLGVTGLPTGVTAAFNPAQASPGAEESQDVQTTSVLTLTVGAGVVVQNHAISVTGTAQGQTATTTPLTLTVTAAPVNGFSIAVNPTTVTVQAGQNGQSTVTVSKTGTFTNPVALSVLNLPTGVTAAFNPVSASSGKTADVQTTSTLTLTVGAAVAAQDYNLTVRGAFTGLPNSDAALTLTVTPAPGGFTMAANPATVNVQQGQNGQSTVTISKTGSFTGNVTLSATGQPANVTVSFNPAAASPPRSSSSRDVQTQSVMTLTVAGSVAVNTYPIVIHGTAQGQTGQTTNVTLNVTAPPPPPGPGNANYKFCDPNNQQDLPIWFAFQNGNGAWTQVTGVVAGDGSVTYTFNITQSTGGVAFVTNSGGSAGHSTTVTYGTQAQLIGGSGTCFIQPPTRTLNGSVAGIGPTDNVVVHMGGGPLATANLAAPNFVLDGVLDGPSDLIALRNTFAPPATFTPIGIIIRRGLNIPNNGTIPVLDFGAGPAEAFAPLAAQITVNNLSGESPILSLGYQTPTTTAPISSAFNAPAGPITMYGVPAAKQQAADLHQLSTFAATATGDSRFRFQWFKTLSDMIVNLGPPLTVPTVTSLGNAPYPRYQSVGPIQAEYDDVLFLSVSPDGASGGDFLSWTITAFRAYFAGGNYTLLMDDMSAAGYLPLWAPAIGELLNLQTQAVGYSTNGITLPNVDGGFADFASRGTQRTP